MDDAPGPAQTALRTFTQSTPWDTGDERNVPTLPRRIADTLGQIDGADVQDVVFLTEIEHRPWHSMTVCYFGPPVRSDR